MSTFTDQFSKLDIPLFGLVRLPEVSISDETRTFYGAPKASSNRDTFKRIVWKGYEQGLARGWFEGQSKEVIIERLKMEFAVFEKTGIIDYLLLVWDFVKWCDDNGIPRGPGRGSVAGSLSAYCCGITRVNPLRHNLNFTRFLSEARAKPKTIDGILYASGKSLCDIDCDISYSQRDRAIAYLDEKYPGRTAKICNRLELTGKMALKEVLKAYLLYNEGQALEVTNHIEAIFGKVESLEEALERHKELRDWVTRDPRHAEAVQIAKSIQGLNIGKGIHASGVYISYLPIDGNVPTELSKTGELAVSYDMSVAAELGVKLDCLALKTLDVIDQACTLAGIKVEDIDVNHSSIYTYLGSTDRYYGMFQIESGVTKEVVHTLRPRHIDDLAASLAIGRPGSLKHKDDLIKYVHTGQFKTIYPPMDEILKPTGGIIIYQETINEICQRIYRLLAVSSDEVRRAIGKKDKEAMAEWEPVLYQQGKENGIPDNVTKYFWDTCNASADYLFSANHCYAYTYITAQTVYLKANHPVEIMLALFRMARHETGSQECIKELTSECNAMGINVYPPDILRSQADFATEEVDGKRGIRFGLSSIKGVSDKTMSVLSSFRREFISKFDVFDAARAAGVDIRVLTSLIYSGCLNWKGTSRVKLALEAQTYNLLSDNQKGKVKQFAAEYNEDIIAILKALPLKLNEKGKPIIASSQLDTLRRKYSPYWDAFQQNSRNENLTHYLLERQYLGFSHSETLHNIFSTKVVGLVTLDEVKRRGAVVKTLPVAKPGEKYPKQDALQVVSFVKWVKSGVSKANGSPYLKGEVEDDTGSFSFMIYSEENVNACKSFNGRLPEEDDLVILSATLSKDGGMLFCTSCIIQENPVATKKVVLKDAVPV